eukprot:TRINITY_DN7040_c0_g2_i1.p1 TRINITY_DN7040_c0_g2~~TRINITY_DN7040_c0_g2_i1.p1  ORF type:complete len:571 (+),score=49.19 TRINITY_DN7040_c0_g2_i1:49-1761(+)
MLVVSAVTALVAAAVGQSPMVEFPLGTVTGSYAAEGVARFAGIPYAVPPLGAKRFKRSILNNVQYPEGHLDATKFKSPCIQNPLGNPSEVTDPEAPPPSEDCLTLNIWAPSNATKNSSLPVMIYIYGGGLCSGTGSNRYQNGSNYALDHNTVVIGFNYRLGALGYLVTDLEGQQTGGMNGIGDQITAISWVHRYISYFGGDPTRITVFGQSSGSYSTCTIAASPLAKGLVHRTIMQSGPCFGGPPKKGWGPMNSTFGASVTKMILRDMNISSVQELQQVKAELVQWPSFYMNNLTVAPYFSGYFADKNVFPEDGIPGPRWERGELNPTELIIGHNSKDGTAAFYGTAPTLGLVPPDKKQTTPESYKNALVTTWGAEIAAKIERQYPLSRFENSPQSAFIQTDADAFVICPVRALAKKANQAGKKVFMYEFSHFQPNRVTANGFGCDAGVELDVVHPTPTNVESGWASHGAEIKYAFGTVVGPDELGPPYNKTHCDFHPAERELSNKMMAHWASLAATGNPNGDAVPGIHWPEYNNGQNILKLMLKDYDGADTHIVEDPHKSDCDFWEALF